MTLRPLLRLVSSICSGTFRCAMWTTVRSPFEALSKGSTIPNEVEPEVIALRGHRNDAFFWAARALEGAGGPVDAHGHSGSTVPVDGMLQRPEASLRTNKSGGFELLKLLLLLPPLF